MTEPLLEVRRLSKHFGGLKALDQINFDIYPDEILGLLGPNGAGKTVCFNLISGVYKPDHGEIKFEGQATTGLSPHQMAARGLGRTFQIVKPFTSLTVLENVIVALGLRHYQSLARIWSQWGTGKSRETAMAQLERVGLENLANRKAGTLPLGSLRKLEIARALCITKKLILLDESFSGLRQDEIDQLEALVRNIKSQGIAVLLIEHNMKVATGLSDRIIVLDHGRNLCEGEPEGVCRDPRVIEAYLGRGIDNNA